VRLGGQRRSDRRRFSKLDRKAHRMTESVSRDALWALARLAPPRLDGALPDNIRDHPFLT
jgi:hypothetical protein